MDRRKLLLTAFFIFTVMGISAHPHIYVDPTVEVVTNGNVVTGIKVNWLWDKWSSEDVKNECDLDRNGSFNTKEIQLVYKYYFENLKNFDYFTEVYINGRQIRITDITGFTALIRGDKRVRYSFTIPLRKPEKSPTKIGLCFSDDTIYVAFEQNVVVLPGAGHQIRNFKVSSYGYYGVQFLFHFY